MAAADLRLFSLVYPLFSQNKTVLIFRKLTIITTTPTIIIMAFIGNRVERMAAMGAAIIPPRIRPMMICQWVRPMSVTNVRELDREMKNSARLTEPIV